MNGRRGWKLACDVALWILLAVAILANHSAPIRKRLEAFRREQTKNVLKHPDPSRK